jgi:hypothetical protein
MPTWRRWTCRTAWARHAAPAGGGDPARRARGKARSNFLLFTMLSSDDPAMGPVALGDYASRNVLPELQRLPGVGQAQLFGTERAMRIWVDPAKLQGFNLSPPTSTPPARAERAGVGGQHRRPAQHGRAGHFGHRGGQRAAEQRGAVWQHRAARQCRRLQPCG